MNSMKNNGIAVNVHRGRQYSTHAVYATGSSAGVNAGVSGRTTGYETSSGMRNSNGYGRSRGGSNRTGKGKTVKERITRGNMIFLGIFLVFLIVGATTGFGIGAEGLIVLDAGHGGHDPGADRDGVIEKEINLAVAKQTEKILSRDGYTVIMTRDDDTFIELEERANIANRRNAALFVSIHCNTADNSEAFGLETYCSTESAKGRALAETIHSQVLKSTGTDDRGIIEKDYAVIRYTRCPAALVEIGYLSNANERSKLTEKSYQKKVAEGIAKGIELYQAGNTSE